MSLIAYHNDTLQVENCNLLDLAKTFSTPTYVYSKQSICQALQTYQQALRSLDYQICYSVKANSNLSILQLLADNGAYFDIVSSGELERCLAAGIAGEKIVFSGVGKTHAEISQALQSKIHCFNVESASELKLIAKIASAQQQKASISLRVNPDVDAKTHPYISTGLYEHKFGIPIEQALALYHTATQWPCIDIRGIDCHIGSQLTTLAPFLAALDRLLVFVEHCRLESITLSHINMGGGLGITYHNEQPPSIHTLCQALSERLQGHNLKLYLEPGRSIVGNAGLLLTRIIHIKDNGHKQFAITDAAMNDLLRPALYHAWHDIIPVKKHSCQTQVYDVVGPVCETADILGQGRSLAIEPGDCLAVMSAGAYGFVMSSNYNSRPRPCEVLVDGDKTRAIRKRETMDDLLALEKPLLI